MSMPSSFKQAIVLTTFVCLTVTGFGVASQPAYSCDPPVPEVRFGTTPSLAVSERMRELYGEDQNARAQPFGNIDWEVLNAQDFEHRREVLAFLEKGKLGSASDYAYAALIMQHGTCPAHYKLANRLAQQAVKLGDETEDTRWLYAATLDRYLRSIGKRQKFGTQYVARDSSCAYKLEPFAPGTTDAERAKHGVPYLEAAKAKAEALSAECQEANKEQRGFNAHCSLLFTHV